MKRIILCLRIYQFGQKIKYGRKCKYGHEWASTMNSRQKKSGCPYCAGLLPIVGVNDLQTTNPELIKEWDYQKIL